MKSLLRGLLCASVLLVLTGCGVQGHWTLASLEPESAKAHFDFHSMCLCKDGRYVAVAEAGGQPKELKGSYKYDAGQKTLTFSMPEGQERAYKVSACCHKMTVQSTDKSQTWKATLTKDKRCEKCGGDPAKCGKKCGGDPAKCGKKCAGEGAKCDKKCGGEKSSKCSKTCEGKAGEGKKCGSPQPACKQAEPKK